jgi:threonine dehydratase
VITFQEIEAARTRIAGAIYYSPCQPSIPLSELAGMEIFCKFDNLQRTGSFKERGGRNALAQLSPEQKKRGVIAASAGNHAQALAYQGRLLGIPATVVMPQYAPLVKVSNCQKLGANVVLYGKDFAEAKGRAQEIGAEKGLAYIDGYDDPAIIAGQGTMGLEIVEQVPALDAVLVPVGGAGLIAGVSLAVKTLRPQAKVIAVEAENVASFWLHWKPVDRRKSRFIPHWPTVSLFRRSAQTLSRLRTDLSISPSLSQKSRSRSQFCDSSNWKKAW